MRLRSLCVCWSLVLLSVLLSSCTRDAALSSQTILGRWQVINKQSINIPHSFFWFSMDYLEFREDQTVWALVKWPPDVGSDIRLNKTAEYSLEDENQVEFVGDCRHQGPCTGTYTVTLQGDVMQLFDSEGRLELKRAGLDWIDA